MKHLCVFLLVGLSAVACNPVEPDESVQVCRTEPTPLSPDGATDFEYCNTPLDLPTNPLTTKMELTQLQVVIRHGDRVPQFKIPADQQDWVCEPFAGTLRFLDVSTQAVPQEYVPPYFFPPSCYMEQLTTIGRDQHLALGHAMRQKYVDDLDFLPMALTPANTDQFFVRSDDEPRTRQSAQAFLVGLYPPDCRSGAPVVTLRTRSPEIKNIEPNTGVCPRLGQLIHTAYPSSDQFMNIVVKNKDLIVKFGTKLGYTVPTSQSAFIDFIKQTLEGSDNIFSRVCHQKALPNDLSKDEYVGMRSVLNQVLAGTFNYEDAAKLGIGPFLGDIRDTMRAAVNAEEQAPRMALWSGHDTTLWPLLKTLGIDNVVTIPYGSHLAFELWQDGSRDYWVAVEFNGKYQTMPGCGSELCKLAEFETAIASFIPVNFQQECVAEPS